MLSTEEFKSALPAQFKGRINDDVMAQINAAITDPAAAEYMRENLISYTSVLQEGKFRLDKYINAVKYCSYRMMGNNKKMSYAKTFPTKYNKWLEDGMEEKDIASHITAFDKSQLVTLILAQAATPLYIVNMDKEQEAINVLADLMTNARSENVQRQSAKDLLDTLKRPEAQKVELDIGVAASDGLESLKEITANLAKQQLAIINSGGMTPKDIAHQEIVIDAERVDD